jgi:flagellar biogenesis protein FliO
VRSDAVRVDVLARRGVGKRASVTVVRIGEQTLLLGVTDQSVRLLTSVEAPDPELPVIERVQPAMRAVDGTAALRPSFLEALREKTVRR